MVRPGVPATALVARNAVVGFVAVVAVCAGVSLPSSPFKLELPGAWFFGVPAHAGGSRAGLFAGVVLVEAGLAVLAVSWWRLAAACLRHGGVPVRHLVAVLVAWCAPVLAVGPMFSDDVFSYAAQGEMVSRRLSPYSHGPAVLGGGAFERLVDPLWLHAPAPYGPLSLQVDGWLVAAARHDVLVSVVLLRLVAVLGVVLIAVCLPRLARAHGRDEAAVFALGVLNPVVVLHFVGGAHNDALMLGLLVAGVTAAQEGRLPLGFGLCWLAVAVKAPALLGVAVLLWARLRAPGTWRRRARTVAAAGTSGAAVLGLLTWSSGLGWGWIGRLSAPGVVHSWATPATAIAAAATAAARVAGLPASGSVLLEVTRGLGLAAAAAVTAVLLWRSDLTASLRALALSLLAFVLLGPVVQPWYLSWGIVLLAPVALGRSRSLLLGISAASMFVGLPTSGAVLLDVARAGSLPLACGAAAALAVAAGLLLGGGQLAGGREDALHLREDGVLQGGLVGDGGV